MKKILLASTALFAFGAVQAMAAEPIKLSIGGKMNQQISYQDNREYMNYNKVDEQANAEIDFKGESKLDNGLTIGAEIDLQATQNNDSKQASGAQGTGETLNHGNSGVLRSFMTVSSAYGQAVLGEREDYGYIVHTKAPDVGWGLAGGNWYHWIENPTSHAGFVDTDNSRYNTRSEKITFITPTYAGFSAGFSYVPNINQGLAGDTNASGSVDNTNAGNDKINGQINRADFNGDMYQGGLTYTNKFGPVGVKSDFAFSQFNLASMQTFQGGTQVTFAGFTLGGSIMDRDVDGNSRVCVGTSAVTRCTSASTYTSGVQTEALMHAGLSWDVGLEYATGPYAISAGYFHDNTKRSGDATNGYGDAYGGAADSTQVYALSGKYTMGPGIDFKNSLYYIDYKNNNNILLNTDAKKAATNNDGIAFVTGLEVKF